MVESGGGVLWGSAVAGPGHSPRKFGFWSILGPEKSRQNDQLAFESGATSESGSTCPLPQRRTTPDLNHL